MGKTNKQLTLRSNMRMGCCILTELMDIRLRIAVR